MELLAETTIHFTDSLLVLLIGMAVIFLALAILVLVVLAYSGIFKAADKRAKANKPEPAPAEPAPASPAQTDDTELVAAITAAIAVVLAGESEDGDVPPFVVKSIIAK